MRQFIRREMGRVWPSRLILLLCLSLGSLVCLAQGVQRDPLPSWNSGPVKQKILDFIARTTKPNGPDFVPAAERIATFDNDGTLWVEQPKYTELAFALDRVKELAPQHPEWKKQQPFKAVLDDDTKALAASGERGLTELVMATHAGMTIDEFSRIVGRWITTAQHPRFHRPYTECAYEPMLEVLAYLRANNFKTYIVTGGSMEFVRPWSERVYGVPPEQVIGSTIETIFEVRSGVPVLALLPKINFVDDGAGKPVGIDRFIGRHPIAAFGNSDGDLQMLQWTASGNGARLMVIVHHTDADREYAYDRQSAIGELDKALDAATEKGWVVVDMKRDWKIIFPFEL